MSQEISQPGEDWRQPILAGKTFHFSGPTGKLSSFPYEDLPLIAQGEGATIADTLTTEVQFLVVAVLKPTSGIETKAAKLNAKGACIKTIMAGNFVEMLCPSQEQAKAMLYAGDEGLTRFAELVRKAKRAKYEWRELAVFPIYDCAGFALGGRDLSPLSCEKCAALDLFDFSGADIHRLKVGDRATLRPMTSTKFDEASLRGAFIKDLIECSGRGADLSYAQLPHDDSKKQIVCCDFTQAEMGHFWFNGADIINCNFEGANLSATHSENIHAEHVSFRATRWGKAKCGSASFAGCDLEGADFSEADLRKVNFQQANLKGANFTKANLMEADFSHAVLDVADFTGAELANARWDGADTSKTKGIEALAASAAPPKLVVGPKTIALCQLAQMPGAKIDFQINVKTQAATWSFGCRTWASEIWAIWSKPDHVDYSRQQFITMQDALVHVMQLLADGILLPETLEVKSSKTGCQNRTVKRLVLEALSELLGADVESEESIQQRQDVKQDVIAERRAIAVGWLLSGTEGVAKWNSQHQEVAAIKTFHGIDLSNKVLDGLEFDSRTEFNKSNFDGTSFHKSRLYGAHFLGSSFRCAQLIGTDSQFAKMDDADLTGANLQNSRFRKASLMQAKLVGANLSGAELVHARLQGADLTGAIIDERAYEKVIWLGYDSYHGWSEYEPATCFGLAQFDEHTCFPTPDRYPSGLTWRGRGVDPRQTELLAMANGSSPLTIEQLLDVLKETTFDLYRVGAALKWLMSDRFELWIESSRQHLVGMVKSQTDPKSAHCCRITARGEFSCCKQNLRLCPGLEGALCKHLWAMLIGFTKTETMPAKDLTSLILATQPHEPTIDKGEIGKSFQRLESREAGETEWEPIVMFPEDYSALADVFGYKRRPTPDYE